MKKTVSFFLIFLCFCAVLCGCSDNRNEAPTSQSVTEPQITTAPTTLSKEELNDKKLDNMISNMSLEEKVGQMFYVRCPESDAVEKIEQFHPGGYILFGRDFDGKTRDEVAKTINSYQAASEIPMLIGVDEEGGTVVRVSSNPNLRAEPFLSPSDTYAEGGWSGIEADAKEKASLLLSLGINVNMAPVCDITSDPDAFMYYRSFSPNTDRECQFVQTVVEISKKNKLGTVLKHFPGYGNNEDTHTGIAYDDREYSEFENKDFKPFTAGINAGADCVLVAHSIVNCIDSEYPASLSKKAHAVLRDELNFDGVIMTDDLVMEAVTDYTGSDSAAVFAAKCGNDLLCCSDVDVQYPAVLEAAKNNEISTEQINASVKRVLKWKQNLGILNL